MSACQKLVATEDSETSESLKTPVSSQISTPFGKNEASPQKPAPFFPYHQHLSTTSLPSFSSSYASCCHSLTEMEVAEPDPETETHIPLHSVPPVPGLLHHTKGIMSLIF